MIVPEFPVNEKSMWSWYQGVSQEPWAEFLDANEVEYISDYYKDAGLLRYRKRPFFCRHYADTLTQTINFLFGDNNPGWIVDLGCGIGTQTILFSLLGAKVLAIDMDKVALGILEKRIAYYQEALGRKLDIEILCGDVFQLDFTPYGQFRALHSMFAFNMMQPSLKLIDHLAPHLGPGSKVAILDGNNQSVWSKLLPSRRRNVLLPLELDKAFQSHGIEKQHHRGGVAIPPVLWRCSPYSLARAVDKVLVKNWFFPVSQHYLGENLSCEESQES